MVSKLAFALYQWLRNICRNAARCKKRAKLNARLATNMARGDRFSREKQTPIFGMSSLVKRVASSIHATLLNRNAHSRSNMWSVSQARPASDQVSLAKMCL